MKQDKNNPIPRATAKRLSLYYRIFKRFNAENIERANSKQIAEAIGIDSATVRRDFSYFTNVAIVGIGNMGSALLHYRFHERNKMKIVMAFDTDDHELVDTKSKDGIPIFGISSLKEKLAGQDIQTAILTVPSVKSQEVASLLVEAGIKGILSFSPVHLSVPKDVVVQYVDLTSELQTLLYFMRKNNP